MSLNKRVHRALSAFSRSNNRWAPVPLRGAQGLQPQRAYPAQRNDVQKQLLSLVSWNVNAFHSRPIARAALILNHILEGPKCPDVVFLQEVTPGVRDSFLNDGRVRSGFLVADAEDDVSFDGVPSATMALLSNRCFAPSSESDPQGSSMTIEGREKLMIEGAFRMPLPSKYGRDALCVNITTPDAPDEVMRLLNVHLDSLDSLPWRGKQMGVLADLLREHGCGRGVIAGDFNAIRPEDDELVDNYRLVDAWVALHGRTGSDGATWGVGAGPGDKRKPRRFDKVVSLGLKAEAMEVIKPDLIEVPRPAAASLYVPWSDHCGLRCTLTV